MTPDEKRELVRHARERAHLLYEGKQVRHRSCGIALAETFGLAPAPYQALRRGGITGQGECGAVKAGELVLGQLLGDPDPTGAVTPTLRAAITRYQAEIRRRLPELPGFGAPPDLVCNTLTRRFADFGSPERLGFCTSIAALVAEVVAETLLECGGHFEVPPAPES